MAISFLKSPLVIFILTTLPLFFFGSVQESKAREYHTAEIIRQYEKNQWRVVATSITIDTCTGYIVGNTFSNDPQVVYQSIVKITKRDYLSGLEISSWLWSELVTNEHFEVKTIRGCAPLPDCDVEKDNLIESCGGNSNVDWTTWVDQTCSGGECKTDEQPKKEDNLGPKECD